MAKISPISVIYNKRINFSAQAAPNNYTAVSDTVRAENTNVYTQVNETPVAPTVSAMPVVALPPIVPQNNSSVNILASFPWLKNHSIEFALNSLQDVKFKQDDVTYMNSMGLTLPFLSGKEAIDFLKENNVRIGYTKMSDPSIHAQYDFEKNFIGINEKYKNTNDFPVILAISEAILHEAGHAKDNDDFNSIQEELQCLALNVLAHKYHKALYPTIFENKSENIIKDGVELYSQLYFDVNPQKDALVKRVQDKYGFLPVGDEKHIPSPLAVIIKNAIPTGVFK